MASKFDAADDESNGMSNRREFSALKPNPETIMAWYVA